MWPGRDSGCVLGEIVSRTYVVGKWAWFTWDNEG